jgi:NAD-dependent dihydropyrimidine dehydrogenase PreA subunit
MNKNCQDVFRIQRKVYFCKTFNLNFNKMAYVISEDCIACGSCIGECPVGAISEGDIYRIDPELCTDCGTCADTCPTEAILPE